MAVNNPVTHWAGATATLHSETPSFLCHQAAQGPGPVTKPEHIAAHCHVHPCLPSLPHGSSSACFIFQPTLYNFPRKWGNYIQTQPRPRLRSKVLVHLRHSCHPVLQKVPHKHARPRSPGRASPSQGRPQRASSQISRRKIKKRCRLRAFYGAALRNKGRRANQSDQYLPKPWFYTLPQPMESTKAWRSEM